MDPKSLPLENNVARMYNKAPACKNVAPYKIKSSACTKIVAHLQQQH